MTKKTKKKPIRRTPEYFDNEVTEITDGEYKVLSPFVKMLEKVEMLHTVCGNTWEVTPNSFVHTGNRCPHCAVKGRPRVTTEEYSERVETITDGEYVVKGEYTNSYTPIPMLHTVCGNEWAVTPGNFLWGSRCPNCAGNAKGGTEKYSSKVETLTGGEFVVKGEYINNSTPILMLHTVCGNEYEVTPKNFTNQGIRCSRCSGHEKGSTEKFKGAVYELVGEEFEVLDEYINAKTQIPMRHKTCGHVWSPTPNSFLSGHRCPNCVYSRGEKAVADTLDSLSIEYIREHSFESLGRKRFDFYLPNERIAIEYDGEFHYKAFSHVGGQEALERTQASDALKDAFCLAENIDLLRIPYWEFDNVAELVEGFVEDTRTFNALFAPNNEPIDGDDGWG